MTSALFALVILNYLRKTINIAGIFYCPKYNKTKWKIIENKYKAGNSEIIDSQCSDLSYLNNRKSE